MCGIQIGDCSDEDMCLDSYHSLFQSHVLRNGITGDWGPGTPLSEKTTYQAVAAKYSGPAKTEKQTARLNEGGCWLTFRGVLK